MRRNEKVRLFDSLELFLLSVGLACATYWTLTWAGVLS